MSFITCGHNIEIIDQINNYVVCCQFKRVNRSHTITRSRISLAESTRRVLALRAFLEVQTRRANHEGQLEC